MGGVIAKKELQLSQEMSIIERVKLTVGCVRPSINLRYFLGSSEGDSLLRNEVCG